MTINREKVRKYLQTFDFRTLFIEAMGWSQIRNPHPTSLQVKAVELLRTPIAEMSGVTVFEIAPAHAGQGIPDAKTRREVYNEIKKIAHENLLIFVDAVPLEKRTQSLWYWMKRDGDKQSPREHLYLKGQPGDLFLSKLDSMVIELDELREDGSLPITDVTAKLSASLDVERVTKKFYGEFSALRVEFIDLIEGIDREADRFWYASVLLNRLMFVYFLQKKSFIQANTHYLDEKLEASQARGADRFYPEFLKALFFEGFAKPQDKRSPEAKALLGSIKYLNGGLFLRHALEIAHPNIHIPDRAFERVLNLFGRYSWHLDDAPGAQDNEINPDVLGYIFEKYINQKAFGAYYTRSEITGYLCERTINAVIVDKVNAVSERQYAEIGDIMLRLDAALCRKLLDILPRLSILDPACGSGAFLVAAMKTMLNIYAAVYGKIRFLNDGYLTAQLKIIDAGHPSINYYIRKRIITDNLYGVDIMEEATEIARLRLFLFLVSSAQTVDQLEPLPNIDFNIMHGNSLIGLLTVNEKYFDDKRTAIDGETQRVMFGDENAQKYRRALDEKNRLIEGYRHASSLTDDLTALRADIDGHKAAAYATLDEILLDEFRTLKIKYEQAQPSGKAKKRQIELADVRTLEPFHWGYEFDQIMGGRGGFDVIVANPPWETFKPNGKEFFAEYSDIVTAKKMRIEDFDREQERLLQDPDVQTAWLAYQSRFPYVSTYYRSAPQFVNQISIVNGKKAGTDINLYKLFTEQCANLLRKGGQCGIVIPSGIYTDLGAKQLREMLFAGTAISGLFGFENRRAIFEGVDSRFKFVVLTFGKGGRTEQFPAAFMRHEVRELERFPAADSLNMSIELIRRMSPDSLSVMEFKSETDVQISEKMLRFPLLGADVPDKWSVKLTREFDMTNDSHLFRTAPAPGRLPLYEGKMIHQFTHEWEGAQTRYWVDEKEGRKAILGARATDKQQSLDYQGYRLGFRDIAASTNERTMIMTVMPPMNFAGNTLIVSSKPSDGSTLLSLAATLDSFVIDWMIRQKITSHVNMFYFYQLPIPRLAEGDPYFAELVERAARLICTTPEFDDLAKEVGIDSHKNGATDSVERARLRAEIDGMVAHLYGLTEAEFTHILGTFPIVQDEVKAAALAAFRALTPAPRADASSEVVLGGMRSRMGNEGDEA